MSSPLRCRTSGELPGLTWAGVVVLHLLICNGGRDGIRDHRKGQATIRNLSVNILGCSRGDRVKFFVHPMAA